MLEGTAHKVRTFFSLPSEMLKHNALFFVLISIDDLELRESKIYLTLVNDMQWFVGMNINEYMEKSLR